ncbi:MAG: response regulator, partial [Thermodesulfobacteriota bacterium]
MADKTVLVVEDEENLLEALKYNLEREGFAVRTAVDGEAGLELARSLKPDLIVLDLMLPKMDGFE